MMGELRAERSRRYSNSKWSIGMATATPKGRKVARRSVQHRQAHHAYPRITRGCDVVEAPREHTSNFEPFSADQYHPRQCLEAHLGDDDECFDPLAGISIQATIPRLPPSPESCHSGSLLQLSLLLLCAFTSLSHTGSLMNASQSNAAHTSISSKALFTTTPTPASPSPTVSPHPRNPVNGNSNENENDDDADADADGWDTPFEGEEGDQEDGDPPEDTDDEEEPISSEERDRIRRLKGKQVIRVTPQDINPASPDTPAEEHHSSLDPATHIADATIQSHASSSLAVSESDRNSPPVLPDTVAQANGVMPAAPIPTPIPALQVIPTSPMTKSHSEDQQRLGAGSLDIPNYGGPRHEPPSPRRRETLNTLSSSDTRSNRRRSFDPRGSSNRLSGFFSNLLNIRDRSDRIHESSPPSSSPTVQSPLSTVGATQGSIPTARSTPVLPVPSPMDSPQIERPITPPPNLPPPTLRDLGLKMAAVTPLLTHPLYSSPPTSGVFLAPSYLLLCHNQGLDVLPLASPPTAHPCALIRRVAFKSVVVMEARGILVAIAGRREAVRVYALDEVRKAVEWRLQVEVEREKEKNKDFDKDGQWHLFNHPTKNAGKRSMDRLRPDPIEASASTSGITDPVPLSRQGTRHSGKPQSMTPSTSSKPPSTTSRFIHTSTNSYSPPPTYASLRPVPTDLRVPLTAPTASSNSTVSTDISSSSIPPPSSTDTSATNLSVMDTLAAPVVNNRPRNGSVSTVSPPKDTHVTATVDMIPDQPSDAAGQAEGQENEDDEDKKKSEWATRDDTDDEALDPVAAGSSASAALDERTSAVAAASSISASGDAAAAAGTEGSLVSPISPPDDATAALLTRMPTRHSVSGSISSRRPSRPSNLDLSAATQFGVTGVGGSQANGLPVVVSPAPTLSTMRHALSFTGSGSGGGTMRPPVLAPRSPRASTSLSLNGAEDGGNGSGTDTPRNEVGSDYISFAQAIQESRVTPVSTAPAPPARSMPSSSAAVRSPPAIALGSPATFLAAPNSTRGIVADASPSTRRVPNGDVAEKKKKRRFSMMGFAKHGGSSTKANSSQASSGLSRLVGASVSTPNLVETAGQPSSSSTQHGHRPSSSRPPVPPLPTERVPNSGRQPVPPVRSPSQTSLYSSLGRPRASPSLQTVDHIFQPQVAPNDLPASPIKPRVAPSLSPTPFATSSGASSSMAVPAPPPPARASRGFFPKLLAGFTRDDRRSSNTTSPSHRVPSEVERRLAAGGATSASAGWQGLEAGASLNLGEAASALNNTPSSPVQAPAPKLEYVKLPGTKGAIAVKAVETAKKSFLAILCGDAGEKIELFAGTYRTALGLSRTFILPDSPRSVELQLQGDDLVELFLVFGQNIFGLEPATVRVREVRIGRAERRAARRRAREARGMTQDGGHDATPIMEDVPQAGETVVMTIARGANDATAPLDRPVHPRRSRSRRSQSVSNGDGGIVPPRPDGDLVGGDGAQTPTTPIPATTTTTGPSLALNPEEIAALAAAAQFGPYTTFQQLSHAPSFPLGVIADDCIIPPTYKDFMQYRDQHEQDAAPVTELLAADNTPATLGPSVPPPPPLAPAPTTPEKWFYIDPKGVTRGPWKANLMQNWFKDGYLPPNLPIRKESETEHMSLKDLCAKASDPDRPFHSVPLDMVPTFVLPPPRQLLSPTSLLTQPKRFGPPALFYTSRGGHSTTIVDSRGKSVLRGRLNWTPDDESTKLGDIKRLEAFDTRGQRAVIVALRQGGIEAVDVGDALFYPGDESRPSLPHFHANPAGISRRPTFVWKLGSSWPAHTGSIEELPSQSRHRRQVTASSSKKVAVNAGGLGSAGQKIAKSDGHSLDDLEGNPVEEVVFLGRHEDTMYFCERSIESFRIFSLCASA
ncbi:hypothetical protein FRB95_009429 [Tulasnella sp. JGI-2019a]|nr:hypothetical protein FRB95_009429 [Tulasnella sp. JGI-2019a]